jgi:hypothetical protein
MKEDAPLLSNGLVDDEQDEWSTGPMEAAPARRASPPAAREEVLARIGAVKKAVYVLVRHCVDELERAAPWELLYYPPEDPDALLAMVGGLVVAIKGVPKKIDLLLRKLPAGETGTDEPAREDIGFLFHGIHRMVAHDIKRLDGVLAPVRDRGPAAPPTPDEGQRLCELSADLKGKYASALMGAAASLIGEGLWNSVELEPVLFPEKAEEFRCTRELVVSLREAVAAIRQLPEQIPFAAVVERWRQEARVDQYALADLPSLRGKIGCLLKESSRRALYSGDYHQISRREVLLSLRINELERLHQQTWEAPAATPPDLAPVFARLVQLTLEMGAVLDADILKGLIGEKKVNGLRGRAVSAAGAAGKGQPPRASASADDDGLDALVPLLSEDDLRIFFEMLLTAVQRRASLTVREPGAPAEAPAPAPPPPPAAARPAPRAPEPQPIIDPRPVLARMDAVLQELQSTANPHWNSFRMTQRLLEKHSRLPAAMFHAVNPFLQEITGRLVPDLKSIAPYKGLTLEAVQRLEAVCRELCREDPSPAQLIDEVPRKLERILRFLDALRSLVQPGA